MEERKCFRCGGFGHIACHCRNVKEEESVQMPPNKFEVLKSKVMQRGEGGRGKVRKDRKEILREERTRRRVEVRQTKKEREEKKREIVERSNSEDWVKAGGRGRRNNSRGIVG